MFSFDLRRESIQGFSSFRSTFLEGALFPCKNMQCRVKNTLHWCFLQANNAILKKNRSENYQNLEWFLSLTFFVEVSRCLWLLNLQLSRDWPTSSTRFTSTGDVSMASTKPSKSLLRMSSMRWRLVRSVALPPPIPAEPSSRRSAYRPRALVAVTVADAVRGRACRPSNSTVRRDSTNLVVSITFLKEKQKYNMETVKNILKVSSVLQRTLRLEFQMSIPVTSVKDGPQCLV